MNKYIKNFEMLKQEQEKLLCCVNKEILPSNGIYERYKNPVLTAAHVPLYW